LEEFYRLFRGVNERVITCIARRDEPIITGHGQGQQLHQLSFVDWPLRQSGHGSVLIPANPTQWADVKVGGMANMFGRAHGSGKRQPSPHRARFLAEPRIADNKV